MCAGGDWQTPVKFEIVLNNDNKVIVNKISDEFNTGMTNLYFLKNIFQIENNTIDDWYEYAEFVYNDIENGRK